MPKLVQLYIRQALVGFALSGIFVGLLLYTNVANLWHLVTHSSGGVIAVIMLFMFNGIVFAGVQFGISIMRMAEDDDTSGGKRQKARTEGMMARSMAPVPVPVKDERHPHRG